MVRGKTMFSKAAAVGAAMGALAIPAWGLPTYSVQSIGVPAGGGSIRGYGINSNGQIAARVDPGPEAYLWAEGAFERLTGGGASRLPKAVNDAGTAAGITHDAGGGAFGAQQVATIWVNGLAVALPSGGAYHAVASAINEANVVAGYRSFGGPGGFFETRAVAWVGGAPVELGTLGGRNSQANDINEHNQVVGSSEVAPGSNHGFAFLWQAGTMIGLGGLTGGSQAAAINDHGLVAGAADVCPVVGRPCVRQAALWEAGVWTPLGALAATFDSGALDVNNSGLAVGYSSHALAGSHATLWSEGSIVDLNDFLSPEQRAAGWVLDIAWGVNDAAQIVATGRESLNGDTRTFLLTPAAAQPPNGVPEPGTAALVGLAAALFGFARRARLNSCMAVHAEPTSASRAS